MRRRRRQRWRHRVVLRDGKREEAVPWAPGTDDATSLEGPMRTTPWLQPLHSSFIGMTPELLSLSLIAHSVKPNPDTRFIIVAGAGPLSFINHHSPSLLF
jgi:hypothetical protein